MKSNDAKKRYTAFISYSHIDSKQAKWLHKKLEGYKVDENLAGRITATGAVPVHLRPVFKDRDDFHAGADLGTQTAEALDCSNALIILCSPAAAMSNYVNEEIRYYRMNYPDRPVIPIIISGEPNHPENECFPASLKFQILTDGSVGATPTEILAADIRESADGKALTFSKVVARMTGLPTDEIHRREERRQTVRTRYWTGGAVVIFLLFLSIGWLWFLNEQQKIRQQSLSLISAAEIAFREERLEDAAKLTLASWPRVGDANRPMLAEALTMFGKIGTDLREQAQFKTPGIKRRVSISEDGSKVAISGTKTDDGVSLFDSKTQKPLAPFFSTSWNFSIFFRDNNALIGDVDDHGVFRLRNLADQKWVGQPIKFQSGAYSSIVSKNGKYLVVNNEGVVQIIDTETGDLHGAEIETGHTYSTDLRLSNDGSRLLARTDGPKKYEQNIELYDVLSGDRIGPKIKFNSWFRSQLPVTTEMARTGDFAFIGNGKTFLIADDEGLFIRRSVDAGYALIPPFDKQMDISRGKSIKSIMHLLRIPKNYSEQDIRDIEIGKLMEIDDIKQVSFSTDGNLLAILDFKNAVHVIDMQLGVRLCCSRNFIKHVDWIQFLRNSKKVAVVQDNLISILFAENVNRDTHPYFRVADRFTHRLENDAVNRNIINLVSSKDGSVIATSSNDNTVRVWRTWNEEIHGFDMSTDAYRVNIEQFDGSLNSFDSLCLALGANLDISQELENLNIPSSLVPICGENKPLPVQ